MHVTSEKIDDCNVDGGCFVSVGDRSCGCSICEVGSKTKKAQKMTDERWEELRDQESYTWFRAEQQEVTKYVDELHEELDYYRSRVLALEADRSLNIMKLYNEDSHQRRGNNG